MRATRVAATALFAGAAACAIDIPDVVSGDGGGDAEAPDAVVDVATPATCAAKGLACVAAAPAGWTGPIAVAIAAAPSSLSCPGGQAQVLAAHQGLQVVPAKCSACTCSVSAHCECSSDSLYSDSSCAAPVQSSAVTNTCSSVTGGAVGSAKVSTPAKVVASCSTGGGALQAGTSSWTSDVLACEAPSNALVQADCASGEVCAPTASAPFGDKLCVMQNGDVACPATYTQKQLVYASANDTQSCSKCTCTVPSSGNCTGVPGLGIYSDSNCGTLITTMAVSGSCVSLPTPYTVMSQRLLDVNPPTLSCSTSGGTLSGTVTPSAPTTVCCLP